jgi:hypothetical protein
MPYEEYSGYNIPQKPDAPIWRYMDLAKLLDLVTRRALFFPSCDKLRAMDPFEGQLTYSDTDLFNADLVNIADEEIRKQGFNDRSEFVSFVKGHQSVAGGVGFVAKAHFISCWHMNDDESDAMWKIYAKDDAGVAIRSSFARLKSAFETAEETVKIGVVNYDDFRNSRTATPYDVDNFYMRKRTAFGHEKELRAVVRKFDMNTVMFYRNADGSRGTRDKHDIAQPVATILKVPGIYVTVDLEKLIEKIVVAPMASGWFSQLVADLIKTLGYKFEVLQSELSRTPV